MSLTNDQIMAKNFQDFYAQIRPYLNGQVPPVFNKFSKSDLYSTDERIVGQWIDGKPLYQKTINFGGLPSSKTTTEVAHNISDIGFIVSISAYGRNSTSGSLIAIPFYNPTVTTPDNDAIGISAGKNVIAINTGKDRSDFDQCYVTLKYTKTTDSPVSIGNDTDYSTTEKIVGTWIDGKPIYQKTIDASSALASTTLIDVYVPTDVSIDSLVDLSGVLNLGTFKAIIPRAYMPGNNDYAIDLGLSSDNQIRIVFGDTYTLNNIHTYTGYVTIRYTKTTD